MRAWFASSDGRDASAFCRLLAPAQQEQLGRARGACIVHTHFAAGFVEGGKVRPEVATVLGTLAQRNGWFVPVGTLLRFLEKAHAGVPALSPGQRRRLEWAWLRDPKGQRSTRLTR